MKKILIVDDEKSIREIVSIALKERGFNNEIICAQNGVEGLELTKKHHPSVIITDLKMPGMLGEEMIRMIKRDPEITPKPKIIAISGERFREEVARAAGCEVFLTKPFSLFILIKEVERLLLKSNA